MTIAFPLALPDLADLLPVERVAWNEWRAQETSLLASGEFLSHDLAPPLWRAEITLAEMRHAVSAQMHARFLSLDGAQQHFYLHDPKLKYPQADPNGSILGSATVTVDSINANRKAWTLSGLPSGYTITIGDWMHVDYGNPSRRALLKAMETVQADGSGTTPEFEIRPHLRPGIVAALEVTLVKPAAKVKLVPDSLRFETVRSAFSRGVFEAVQTLAAG